MTSFSELPEFEWMKPKPVWGEIPEARAEHFAFVKDHHMYILGGQIHSGIPDMSNGLLVPYLNLHTWTWDRQPTTGSFPTASFHSRECLHDKERNQIRVIIGPRWENGINQIMDIFVLDLSTWQWTKTSPKGRWNINWKTKTTVFLSSINKIFQIGEYPYSNFSDLIGSGSMIWNSSTGWSTFMELKSPERDSFVLAAVPFDDDGLIFTLWTNSRTSALWSLNFKTNSNTCTASSTISWVPPQTVLPIVLGGQLYLFDDMCLASPKIVHIEPTVDIPAIKPIKFKTVKSHAKGPQKPRVGASVVHYDGFLIFFGGALSRDTGVDTKYTNDIHVLEVGTHHRIESILDELAAADLAAKDQIEQENQQQTSTDAIVEISPSKNVKKNKKKKKVVFESEENKEKEAAEDVDEEVDEEVDDNKVDDQKADPAKKTDESATSSDNKKPDEKNAQVATETEKSSQVNQTTPQDPALKFLDDHQDNLFALLQHAVNNPDCYPDMAFKVNGRIIWAHKAIIASRSSRWKSYLDPKPKASTSSPLSARKVDLEDSQLDVSNESAMPKDRASPLMFGKLGSSSIELMLDEEEKVGPSFEMIDLPKRGSASSNSASPSISVVSDSPDAIRPSSSNSGISPPSKQVQAWILEENYNVEHFLKVLTYMYTGKIEVNHTNSESIADIAFEFLLDDVTRVCRSAHEKSTAEPIHKLGRMLRRLVGSPTGSDYFFVVNRKKLFAHRFIIYLFSPHFRKLMLSRPDKAYAEVKEISEWDLPVETFIDFCRMMYCNFTSLPEHQEKKMDVENLTKLATHWEEYRCLILLRGSKSDLASTISLYRTVSHPTILRDVRRSIMTQFSKFVQDNTTLETLSKKERKEWLELAERAGVNWLDKLWFAHATKNTELKKEAIGFLGVLINVENVLPVLFGAHQVGAKELRSLCLDFMSAHSTSIEDSQRMQQGAPMALGKLPSLSDSVNHELSSKMSIAINQKASNQYKLKNCGLCSKSFSTFGKKATCILCKKTACGDCTKRKVNLPPIFGLGPKPKDICISCAQVVDIWNDPSAQIAAKK